MQETYPVLLYLAEKGALFRSFQSSTSAIARDLRISQQSVSRKLREMEGKGLVHRSVSPHGVSVGISEKGRQFLRQNYERLKNAFDSPAYIQGTLVSGLGEGRYYMSLAGYQKQFIEKLGFKPYIGTLNIKVDSEGRMRFLQGLKIIYIDGFSTKSRTFGGIKCYAARINGVAGAVMVPERTGHDADVMECIAPVYLRSRLKIKDGDKVTIKGGND